MCHARRKTLPVMLLLLGGSSSWAQFCHPSPNGSVCEPLACSDIPEDQCLPGVIHLDIATGALTVDDCQCRDFNTCHIRFGNASPFPAGHCPDGQVCQVVSQDTDNDGMDDTFTAECGPPPCCDPALEPGGAQVAPCFEGHSCCDDGVWRCHNNNGIPTCATGEVCSGVCCLDVDDGPIRYDTCATLDPSNCATQGGVFAGANTDCSAMQACCFMTTAAGTVGACADLHPKCCVASGGVPGGVGTACGDPSDTNSFICPQVCGGLIGIPCNNSNTFCKTAPGECCCDHFGLCTARPDGCPAIYDPVCGCDGVTYSNACEAAKHGVSIDHPGRCGIPCSSNSDCPAVNQFCKFPPGACGDANALVGMCINRPTACPDIYDPVCGCDGVTYGNECDADAAGVSVAHPGECPSGPCSATRVFQPNLTPSTFCDDVPLVVDIVLNLPNSATAMTLEDMALPGWQVVEASHGGTFDPVNRKVKWGPFFAPFPDRVTYVVKPTPINSLVACFQGEISVDGVNELICGAECLGWHCPPHMPADSHQPPCPGCPAGDCRACSDGCHNGVISLCELASYACAWKKGCNADLSGVSRAAYIWRNGECYCQDGTQGNWHVHTCPPPISGLCEADPAGPTAANARGMESSGASVGITPTRSLSFSKQKVFELTVQIDAPTGATAAALEIELPTGWAVSNISDGGAWDDVHRQIKWGPFMDGLSRSLTASLTPAGRLRGARIGDLRFLHGTVSFDGVNQPISIR